MAEQKQRVRQLSSHNISVYVVRVADIWADVPPLGVVLCVAIVLDTLYVGWSWVGIWGKPGTMWRRLAERQRVVAAMTTGSPSAMWKRLWVMTFPSSMFWSFFVFDILGSKVEEAREAIWVAVVIASLPMVTWLVGMMVARVWQPSSSLFGVMRRMRVSRDLVMNEVFDQRFAVEGDGSSHLRPRKPLEGESELAERARAVLGDGGPQSTQSRDGDCGVEPTTAIVAWDSNPMPTSEGHPMLSRSHHSHGTSLQHSHFHGS